MSCNYIYIQSYDTISILDTLASDVAILANFPGPILRQPQLGASISPGEGQCACNRSALHVMLIMYGADCSRVQQQANNSGHIHPTLGTRSAPLLSAILAASWDTSRSPRCVGVCMRCSKDPVEPCEAQCSICQQTCNGVHDFFCTLQASGLGPSLLVLPAKDGGTLFEAWRPLRGEDSSPAGFGFEGHHELLLHSKAWAESEW